MRADWTSASLKSSYASTSRLYLTFVSSTTAFIVLLTWMSRGQPDSTWRFRPVLWLVLTVTSWSVKSMPQSTSRGLQDMPTCPAIARTYASASASCRCSGVSKVAFPVRLRATRFSGTDALNAGYAMPRNRFPQVPVGSLGRGQVTRPPQHYPRIVLSPRQATYREAPDRIPFQ